MAAAKMSVAELEQFLRVEFPQAFANGDIRVERADGETCLLRERYSDRMLRPRGRVFAQGTIQGLVVREQKVPGFDGLHQVIHGVAGHAEGMPRAFSFTRGGVMIPGEKSPTALYRRLFVQGTAKEVQAPIDDLRLGRSLLDFTNDSAKRLQRDLGPRDRERLDQYFTSVRDLEKQLLSAEDWEQRPKPKVKAPPPEDVTDNRKLIEQTRRMYDMIRLAFETDSTRLIEGVCCAPLAIWPDDRGYFLEVQRAGLGLVSQFPRETTQVSAALNYPGIIKAFHFHLHQTDVWTPAMNMLQVALVDLRPASPTYGRKNTLYIGNLRPWQILIPPGVAHGYKVLSAGPSLLIYATDRFYEPSDEGRIPYDDQRLNYDWELQHK